MMSVWRIAALLCITCQHRADSSECAWSQDDAEEMVSKNFGQCGVKSLGIDPKVFADWLNKKFAEATGDGNSGDGAGSRVLSY